MHLRKAQQTTKGTYCWARAKNRSRSRGTEFPVLSFWVNCGVIAVLVMLGVVRLGVVGWMVGIGISNRVKGFLIIVLMNW